MTADFKQSLINDYRNILEHPDLTTDMKIGFLINVVQAACQGGPTIRQTVVMVREFVLDYIRNFS